MVRFEWGGSEVEVITATKMKRLRLRQAFDSRIVRRTNRLKADSASMDQSTESQVHLSAQNRWEEKIVKYMLLIAVAIFVAVAGTIPARAQVLDTIIVDVPFEFTVRNTVLPAGEYTVKRLNPINPSVMELLDSDGHAKVLFIVGSADIADTPTKPELIFDRVGDRYFLSEIFESWDNVGVELQKTRAEHQLEEGAMSPSRHVTIVGQSAPDEKR